MEQPVLSEDARKRYRWVLPFVNVGDRWIALAEQKGQGGLIFINSDGERLYGTSYKHGASGFARAGDRFLAVVRYNWRWANFITPDGEQAKFKDDSITYRINAAQPFVQINPGLYLSAIQYEVVHTRSVGLHINQDGQRAYKEAFDWVGSFKKRGRIFLAEVSKDGEYFLINRHGKRVD
ncbi:MAG: hypothetical protein WA003_03695 [Desulfuromonadaceae bacterium]